MSFPRYPAYKDSSVDWLGRVPEHWRVDRLKRNLSLLTEKSDSKTNPVALENIEGWSGRFIASETEFEGDGVRFDTGDILFGKLRPYLAKVLLARWPGEAVGDFHVLRAKPSVFPRFAQYLMLTRSFIDIVDGSTFGSKMPRAGWEFVGDMPLPIPSFDEQKSIVAFLDRETAKIDDLVAEQEQLITLLKEKRQAVISHAVTKGLDPSVPMKDSGVEWLGEVPAHWEVTHLKRRCAVITDGAHISPETEGGVHLFVSTKDISDDGIDFDSALRTSPASYEYMIKTGCQPIGGDVLFSKDGTIGRTVVVNGSIEFVIASSLIIIRPIPDQLNSDFLNALCQSWVVSQQVDGFVKGAGLPRLSIQNLLKVVGVFPPIDEQVQIANYLSDLDMRSRTLALEAERTVALLKERRSALISAAVTGQIDVRGLAPAQEQAA